jgi:hypothetical protein
MSEPEKNSSEAESIIWIVVCLFAAALMVFALPNFIKARSTSAANACINSLRQIDAAKNQWALENAKTNGVIVTENDIKPYIKLNSKGNIPRCPQSGIYTIGKVGENPTCSIGGPGHTLP